MKRLFTLILLVTALVSCDKSIEDSFSGWYADVSDIAQASDFERINEAIRNNECIYTTGYSHNYDNYASRDIFFTENGMWNSLSANYGTCRFLPSADHRIEAWHFVNNNTVIRHIAWLWDPSYLSPAAEYAAKTYAGPIFGELVYYCENPSAYTYAKIENKILVSNGDIFTITDSGLIKDGTYNLLTKYNQSKSF